MQSMSDTSSLYRITPSPTSPTFRYPPELRMGQESSKPERATVGKAEPGSAAKASPATTRYRRPDPPYRPYRAPTAQMTLTPSGKLKTSKMLPTPTSLQRTESRYTYNKPSPPVLRSKRKEEDDYQAEADRSFAIQESADPDYTAPPYSTASTQETPRKRRRERSVEPSSSSRKVKQSKQNGQRHIRYEKCQEETKAQRDKYISRIEENWKLPYDQWMPKTLLPTAAPKRRGGKREVLQPQDWNTRTLEELSYLASKTKDSSEVAFQALQDAVSRINRDGSGPALLPQDVHHAIKAIGSVDTDTSPIAETSKGKSPVAPREASSGEQDTADIVNTQDIDQNVGHFETQLPSPHSPAVAEPSSIKQEAAAVPKPSMRPIEDLGAWEGYDEEMEKYEEKKLYHEELEARADAKRAKREVLEQKRRIREMVRQHGKNKDDAILIRPEES